MLILLFSGIFATIYSARESLGKEGGGGVGILFGFYSRLWTRRGFHRHRPGSGRGAGGRAGREASPVAFIICPLRLIPLTALSLMLWLFFFSFLLYFPFLEAISGTRRNHNESPNSSNIQFLFPSSPVFIKKGKKKMSINLNYLPRQVFGPNSENL
jgi:hypothetical protein